MAISLPVRHSPWSSWWRRWSCCSGWSELPHAQQAVSPADAILNYAEHNDVGHIVVGARASSAIRRHLGSVSTKVVAQVLCSVSVVRLKAVEEQGRRPL
ncbi:universal stress protein [Mesorhizobium sp. M0152]|uniref:universal stress protein n=1 Tax=Mesorhizobium sp. M0152 TaxID=2956898 RepID=UPI0033392762